MKRIIELGHEEEIGAMVYALVNFDSGKYLKEICQLHLNGNAEVNMSTTTILAEQIFETTESEVENIKNMLIEHDLTFEDLQIKYNLTKAPLIKISTTGKLFNVTLLQNVEWESFYETVNKLKDRLKIDFTEKIEDFDSKYWSFLYEEKAFTIHYNSLVGDVEIFTDFENGTNTFEHLLRIFNKKSWNKR